MALTTWEKELVRALEPFAAYADPHRRVPRHLPVTQGSGLARRQVTMGDCYDALDAIVAAQEESARREQKREHG